MALIILKDELLLDLKKEGVVIVDYFATWCGPCKMLTPVLETLSDKKQDLKIIKIDVDTHQEIAIKDGVMSVPTLVLYKDGKELKRQSGYMDEATLTKWIDLN